MAMFKLVSGSLQVDVIPCLPGYVGIQESDGQPIGPVIAWRIETGAIRDQSSLFSHVTAITLDGMETTVFERPDGKITSQSDAEYRDYFDYLRETGKVKG